MEKGPGDRMSTDFISAELVDYLNNELPAARRKQIEKLLDSNPERARELEEYKRAQQVVKKLRVQNASDDFNTKVQARIANKIADLRAKGSVRFRTARERVDAAREGLSAREIKRRGRRALFLGVLAFLVVAVPLGLGAAYWTGIFEETAAQRREIEKDQKLSSAERRRRAPRAPLETDADGSVSGLHFLADGPVRLMSHERRHPRQRCIFVYDGAAWREFLRVGWNLRGTPRHEAWLDARNRAETVQLVKGRLLLSKRFRELLPASAGSFVALRLRDHAEIWVEKELDEYLTSAGKGPSRPPEKPGKGPRMRWVPE
jgi:anti-sigma factor RsiW